MKTSKLLLAVMCVLIVFAARSMAADHEQGKSGEELFKENCAVCHPDGGNIINPKKTLHKKDREANNVKSAADIMGKMRNPGEGMTQFDKNTISDKDAGKIAKYILKTFK
jgi:cytochrome c6